jgi:hypothetical protein
MGVSKVECTRDPRLWRVMRGRYLETSLHEVGGGCGCLSRLPRDIVCSILQVMRSPCNASRTRYIPHQTLSLPALGRAACCSRGMCAGSV